MTTNERTTDNPPLPIAVETYVTYGAYEPPIGYVSQWRLVRLMPSDWLPLPHGPFNHTSRCNTGGCHE